jgi:methylenetetrahydrofolate--tRNA-(uracil-5-)-methyltransferase
VNAPRRLSPTLELKARHGLYLAGQMAGVEGYVESAALGFVAGVNASRSLLGQQQESPPRESAHGALIAHLMEAEVKHFQPMNVNYGLFPALGPEDLQSADDAKADGRRKRRKLPKREKNEKLAQRGLRALLPYRDAIAPGAAAPPPASSPEPGST